MVQVYIWPASVPVTKLHYGDANRIRTTTDWLGGQGQITDHQQRAPLIVEGTVWEEVAPDFDILEDRLRGGQHLFGLIDIGMRGQFGWDMEPAIDSSGNEFWRADGKTALYNGEAANPPSGTWRSINALANGGAAADATSLAVDGLLDSEAIPKGVMIRIGDFRYRVLAEATANASGEATLTLASPLRATVADNEDVRIPGDFFVGFLRQRPEISPLDHRRLRTYRMRFNEAYASEYSGGFTYTVD